MDINRGKAKQQLITSIKKSKNKKRRDRRRERITQDLRMRKEE